jgi:hypothetical protein
MIKLIFCMTLICSLSASAFAEKNWGIPTNKSKNKISSYADVLEKYGQSYHKDKDNNGKKQSEQSNSMNYYNQIPPKTTTKQQGK